MVEVAHVVPHAVAVSVGEEASHLAVVTEDAVVSLPVVASVAEANEKLNN